MPQILLIDDDEALRAVLRGTLERAGDVVIEAADGRAGVDAYAVHRPDLVLTDMIMSRMDGVEVVAHLKRLCPAVKVIAMSAGGRLAAGDHLRIAIMMGACYALAKPFSAEELTLAVAHALSRG
jgi:CheY-like chemotaxis protein